MRPGLAPGRRKFEQLKIAEIFTNLGNIPTILIHKWKIPSQLFHRNRISLGSGRRRGAAVAKKPTKEKKLKEFERPRNREEEKKSKSLVY